MKKLTSREIALLDSEGAFEIDSVHYRIPTAPLEALLLVEARAQRTLTVWSTDHESNILYNIGVRLGSAIAAAKSKRLERGQPIPSSAYSVNRSAGAPVDEKELIGLLRGTPDAKAAARKLQLKNEALASGGFKQRAKRMVELKCGCGKTFYRTPYKVRRVAKHGAGCCKACGCRVGAGNQKGAKIIRECWVHKNGTTVTIERGV